MICVWLLVPAQLLAHAHLKSSRPRQGAKLVTMPKRIELDFSETPELALTTITLVGPDGKEIPLGSLERSSASAQTIVAPIGILLGAGSYRIRWRTAAEDGHPTSGVVTFDVMPASTAPVTMHTRMMQPGQEGGMTDADRGTGFGVESPLYVSIRWIQFLALLIVIGAVTFRQLVLSFLKRKEDPDSPMIPDAARGAARLGEWAAAVLLLVAVTRLGAQSYMMYGGTSGLAPGMMGSMMTRTLWGRGWFFQIAGIAIAGVGFHKAREGDSSRWWLAASLGAFLLAFTPAFAGHASSSPRLTALAIFADGLHVIGGGGWLGSLLMVIGVGIPAALRLPTGRRGPMVAEVVNAYSPIALTFAGIISTTGVFAAWLHLGSVPALWTTDYGKTLLIKLGILSIVAATGAYNWVRVKPHLGLVEGAAKIRRTAMIELVVGVLVVLATAVLVALSTPRDAALNGAAADAASIGSVGAEL